MIVYNATKSQFNDDVNFNRISDIILHNLREKRLSGGQLAEYHSWQNSLHFMRAVIDDPAIPGDVEVAVEYQIPRTSKRVDFMIAGADGSGSSNVIVIELKQWDKAEKVDGKAEMEDIMKSILGFSIGETPETTAIAVTPKEEQYPVRSLVSVRFIRDGRTLTYYNDRFALEPGDRVFVSGKLAGQMGIVESVTTRFRINLADYQRVIAKAGCAIHGTYESIMDKMVSYDRNALSPEEFRSWILPPAHWDGDGSDGREDEIIVGDGYELGLSDLEMNEDVNSAVLDRALDYCRGGNVAYISVRNGIGTAFVEGTSWYEINFRLCGDTMTEMYCDCPYPGLCKHMLAVGMTIRAMVRYGNLDSDADFVAIGESRFWSMVAQTTKKITL